MAKKRAKKEVRKKVSKKVIRKEKLERKEKIPMAPKKPEKKVLNKILIGIIIALVILLIAVTFIYITNKPKDNTTSGTGNSVVESVGTGTAGTAETSNVDMTTKEAKLALCLKEKGAIFYGADWCPHCTNQKAMFGEAVSLLPYIECTTAENAQKCKNAGVSGIPDWRINGKQYLGEKTLQQLASVSGCVY
jgi:glutaredoxin